MKILNVLVSNSNFIIIIKIIFHKYLLQNVVKEDNNQVNQEK